MLSFKDVFEEVKNQCLITGSIGKVPLDMWVGSMTPISFDGKTAVFKVHSDFQKNIITQQYLSILLEEFKKLLGFEPEIVISIMETTTQPDLPTFDELDERKAELEKSFKFADYDYTFDTFIEGRSNEFALAASKAVAKNTGTEYNPLFIYGPSGLGKTHLITAIANEVKKNNPNFNVIYITSETFGNELIQSINNKKMPEFHEKYRSVDLLLIDDVQFIANKDRTQEEFFHTFYKLHEDNKQIVITSDRPPRELSTLEERLRTRFEGGLIADISEPDFETRIAIIRRKAELLNINIPDEVAEFIANKLKTNIRQLEGAVKKLKALKALANSSPSISMAQSVIREILTDDQPAPITVEKIITEVGSVYSVSPDDIRSNKRSSQISTARKTAMYIVREITQMPLASIGTEFGGRDHSTVVYAINDIGEKLAKDSSLSNLVNDIIKNIKDKGAA